MIDWLFRQPWWKRALIGALVGACTMLLLTETLRWSLGEGFCE